jgi:hypothetical protein
MTTPTEPTLLLPPGALSGLPAPLLDALPPDTLTIKARGYETCTVRRVHTAEVRRWERQYCAQTESKAAGHWEGKPVAVRHPNHDEALRLIISLDPTPQWGFLLHLSVSLRSRTYPDWDLLIAAKDAVFGDVDAAMIMPKADAYVNYVPHGAVFHVYQTPERWDLR